MRRRRKGAERNIGKQAHELVAETEAFLRGSIAELLDRPTGDGVPPWAWLNALAHGTLDDIRRAATDRADGSLSPQWHHARSVLAAEVLAAAGATSLAMIQAEVLVPLELRLASRNFAARMEPEDLLVSVLSELAP